MQMTELAKMTSGGPASPGSPVSPISPGTNVHRGFSTRLKWGLGGGIGLAAISLIAVALLWSRLVRERPQVFSDPAEAFKYGSIGTEKGTGFRIPLYLWQALPEVFPDLLPGPAQKGYDGYRAFGFLFEPGHPVPVGLTVRTVGQPMVGLNCALCHAGGLRTSTTDAPRVILGAPAHQLDLQAYFRFLWRAAADPRWNGRTLMAVIERDHPMDAIDRLLYRYLLIPKVKEKLIDFGRRMAWMDSRPDWGRGRIDPFNPVKFGILERPIDDTIGNADHAPVWNMGPRARGKKAMHWDGLASGDLREVVLSSALGASTMPKEIPVEALGRIESYIEKLDAPRYPFSIDQALANKGKALFDKDCARCHAADGALMGTVIPLSEVGTDRHRLDMWREPDANAYNGYAKKYPWGFSHFRNTGGYTAVPLDGIWMRAPYLHNGSVPSLVDLLEERRPPVFYRGSDLFDPTRVGFVSEEGNPARGPFKYDVSLPGNGNGGHLFGTRLSSAEKGQLVEYLKTL